MHRSSYKITPEVNGFYVGTVRDVSKYGLKVQLNGFSSIYEGMINTSELMDDLSQLIVGNLIRVRVMSVASDGFITITTVNVEQPINKGHNLPKNLNDDIYNERKKRIRVASPGRREISQFTASASDRKVSVKFDDPPFLKNITSGYISPKIPTEIRVFKNEYSHMAKVAKQKMTNSSTTPFYFTEGGFADNWYKGSTTSSNKHDLVNNSSPVDFKTRSKMSIQQQRKILPIYKHREEIIKAVTDNRVLIVIAETGSGKTTQIPQYLIEAGFVLKGKVACTQPRRFAAISVAHRVADEYGCVIGKDVGYKIRFEDCTSPSTIIKYMTDGILLRECLSDANLDKYSVIVLDEAHERTIHTDVLFGLLKDAVKRRPSLRLVISSATLDSAKFSKFFDNAKVLNIPGSMYPVETYFYRYQTTDYFNVALNTALNIHLREEEGDILLFLTGQDEIERACEELENYIEKNRSRFSLNLLVFPMFSALPPDLQTDVLMPTPKGTRKIIVATNIAEASVTIDGIRFVIDPGYAKQKFFDSKKKMDALTIIPISQASANQRLGRAGRTAPGKCYRLYTETAYCTELLAETIPEIQRSDLSSIILYLKAIGISQIVDFDFMDPPQKDNIFSSLKLLYQLGALDGTGKITEIGLQMTQLPVDPNLAKMLITSVNLKCSDEITIIIGMLSVGNVFFRPKKQQALADEKKRSFDHAVGDHLRLLNVYKKWEINFCSAEWCKAHFLNEKKLIEAFEIRKNLMYIMDRHKYDFCSAGYNYERVQKAITSGFFQNIASRNASALGRSNKSYKIVDSLNVVQPEVHIHPSSSLFHQLPSWIVFNNLTETSKKFLSDCTVINPEWLGSLFPHLYEVTGVSHGSIYDDLMDFQLSL